MSSSESVGAARGGFTLVEILIVISIIGLLSALIMPSLGKVRKDADIMIAEMAVAGMHTALESYVFDEGILPGSEQVTPTERNDFPALYAALWGTRRPAGPGGRSAPYLTYPEENVAVDDATRDGTGEESENGYRRATREERWDDAVKKYLLDPWSVPYVYRVEERGNARARAIGVVSGNRVGQVYSGGPNGVDETARGAEPGDDILR